MGKSRWAVFVSALGLLTSNFPVIAANPQTIPARGRFVRLDAKASSDAARLALAPRLAIDYGSFSLVELEDADFVRLKSSGISYHDQSQAYSLILGESRFDPLHEAPTLPAAWAAQPRADGKAFRLVQFVGPTKSEWLDRLRADGAEIVQYLHPYTYIIYSESTAVTNQLAIPVVRWAGEFHPAYKVMPRWRALAAEPVATKVVIFRGAGSQGIVESVKALGGKLDGIASTDPAFDVATFQLPGDKFLDVAALAGVYSIQPIPTDGGLRGEMSNQVNVNNVNGSNQAFPGYLTWLSGVGLSGAGVRIANVDGGVQETHTNLVNRFVVCVGTTCSATSSSHGTHTAGIMAADGTSGVLDSFGFQRGLGVAPGANLVEQVYSPWFQNPGGMLLLMTDSYNNGASLSGNSWGPAGSPQGYDDDTRQCDVGVRDADPVAPGNQPLSFVLSFMNGNGGTSSQGSPDEGKNIFTIGSTKMQTSGGTQILEIDDLSSNSAHGPALDGRKIPHMVAPGCYVDSTVPTNSYGLNCGTSMASPHVSGAVALFIEYYRGLPDYTTDPSPALVKAAFLAIARDLAGHLDADGGTLGHVFDNKQGWGRMDLEAVVDPANAVQYIDNPVVFNNTGEEWVRNVSAEDPSKPIRIMLVWTDAPGHGLGGSSPAWNNNLDLTVVDGANTYRGNVFDVNGWSTTGGSADDRNNTEGVFIGPTAPNAYTIRVSAANINSDGVPNSGDATDQDFAIVCYNCAQDPTFTLAVTPTPQSVCAPDDAVYKVDVGSILGFSDAVTLSASGHPAGTTAGFGTNPITPPDSTTMTISNTGAASAGSYDILVTGTSGPTMRSSTVRLNLFTASPGISTLLTPPNGDTNQTLRPNFTWTAATQAATYTIEIATDAGFGSIVQSASGLTSPAFTPASDLAMFTTHYWRIRATNTCGTGPGSAVFSFTTRAIPPILLVDDDDNSPDVRSYYTTALNALGKSYDVWNTNNTDTEPSAAELSPYKIVIWFTGDEFGGFCGPGAAGESALGTWLSSGKRLWMVSQDYLYDRDSPSGVPTLFMQMYLGMASPGQNDITQTTVTGQNVFSGLGPYTLSYPFANFSDRISPNETALLAFSGNAGTPPQAAISKDSGAYRTVFFGYPWEAIPTPAGREAVMQRVLDWFTPQCGNLRGDMNGSTTRDGADIAAFTNCLIGNNAFAPGCGCADMDMSGDLSQNDQTLFVDCLLNGTCP
ncbi:MAG TPA: S8 family serine peptidase [Phycisphaerae bacterium]|nr:S8 family serine peptidase [Phycisphaerae bacterium]